ncbi:Chalcone synthase 2 [Golovinomyces cichoracearum]|uniref:Chalcone synthase 2 n=1 Tax=Golovinomyces cichoracearum TaxID=62708 RepID=A0A420IPA2_9PEZI|nr:Chalcone synthase 2 [Golovinomyces cichoracearum]
MSGGNFDQVNLSIIGIAAEYPPFKHEPKVLDKLAKLYYPESAALDKVRMINRYTGIDSRSAIVADDFPLVNMKNAPNISQLSAEFLTKGVALAVAAARKALLEAQTSASEITHIVSTTCTNSANPGFDHFVMKELGITQPVEKVLLQGIGCSGGLAALRTAANLALGHTFRGLPARILVVALDICSLLIRSELDSIVELEEARVGVTLFSDCGSSLVLSNGLGHQTAEPVYELLGWDHRLIPDSDKDLRFDAHPNGWKVVLSPQVPKLTCGVVKPGFDVLMKSMHNLPPNYKVPSDFDWALHPGGSTILTGVEKELNLSSEHLRASYDIYMNHGNSSSPTVLAVLSRLRDKDMDGYAPGGKVKDFVFSASFGPGITVETCLLKRNLNRLARDSRIVGHMTPPETESEGSRSEADDIDSESNSPKEAADFETQREASVADQNKPPVQVAPSTSTVPAKTINPIADTTSKDLDSEKVDNYIDEMEIADLD